MAAASAQPFKISWQRTGPRPRMPGNRGSRILAICRALPGPEAAPCSRKPAEKILSRRATPPIGEAQIRLPLLSAAPNHPVQLPQIRLLRQPAPAQENLLLSSLLFSSLSESTTISEKILTNALARSDRALQALQSRSDQESSLVQRTGAEDVMSYEMIEEPSR